MICWFTPAALLKFQMESDVILHHFATRAFIASFQGGFIFKKKSNVSPSQVKTFALGAFNFYIFPSQSFRCHHLSFSP